jgi:hypothetical protein
MRRIAWLLVFADSVLGQNIGRTQPPVFDQRRFDECRQIRDMGIGSGRSFTRLGSPEYIRRALKDELSNEASIPITRIVFDEPVETRLGRVDVTFARERRVQKVYSLKGAMSGRLRRFQGWRIANGRYVRRRDLRTGTINGRDRTGLLKGCWRSRW